LHLSFAAIENEWGRKHRKRYAGGCPILNAFVRLGWDRTNLDSQVLYQGAAFSRAEKRHESLRG